MSNAHTLTGGGTFKAVDHVPEGFRFVDWSELCDRVGAHRTTIEGWIKSGQFPPPIPIGPRRVKFLESEVNSWLANRLAARNRAHGLPEVKPAKEVCA